MNLEDVMRCTELTSSKGVEEFMPTPTSFVNPKWIPEIAKMVLWMGMQHVAAAKSYKIFESQVRIRLKPSVGVLATATLAKGSCFPIISSTIMVCDRSKMTVASFRSCENVHVVPTRPAVRQTDEGEELIWNPGSAIRLTAEDAKRSEIDKVNCEMVRKTVAVVSSCMGDAREHMAVIPAITTTREILQGEELVCLMDPEIYVKPPQRDKKRWTIVQHNTKALKKIRSDPLAVVA